MRISGELPSTCGVRADSPNCLHGVDVVVLAGAIGHEHNWTGGLPRPLLPLVGTTVIEALLVRFQHALSGSRAVCANGHTHLIAGSLSCTTASRIHYFEDKLPRGTAGCLRDCAARLQGDTFLVSGGSVWLEDDPRWIVEQHRLRRNALTVCCTSHDDVTELGGHRRLKPSGLFCCDRSVIDFIRPTGFQDLKEQTIPALQKAGLRVGVVVLNERTTEILSWHTYMRVLGRVLTAGLFPTQGYEQAAPGVWIGRNVQIASDARIVGPALLADGCRIGAQAVVLGPALLGKNGAVGAGAWVERVWAEPGVNVAEGRPARNQFLCAPGTAEGRFGRRINTSARGESAQETATPRSLATLPGAIGRSG